jgi:hypothetical protein
MSGVIAAILAGNAGKQDKIVATGGTVYTKGDWKVHVFRSSGTFAVSQINDGTTTLQYALADGGQPGVSPNESAVDENGGGGGDGGQGGNYAVSSEVAFNTLFSTSNYSVTVGAAGSSSSLVTTAGTKVSTNAGGAGGGGGGGSSTEGQDGDSGGSGGAGSGVIYWWPAPDYSDYTDFGMGGNAGGGGGSYINGTSTNGGTGGSNEVGSGGNGGSSNNNGGNGGLNSVAPEGGGAAGGGGSGGGGRGGSTSLLTSSGNGTIGQAGAVLIRYKYK